MGSLKDALLKAGLKGSKTENERKSNKGRVQTKIEKHQHSRNFCDHCSSVQPDVERYNHRNPTTDAQWICVLCADKLMIDDKFRATNQSDFAKKKIFKRDYGATKSFDEANMVGRAKSRNKSKQSTYKDNDNRGNRKKFNKNSSNNRRG